jgi:glycerophosphoryl diester phosphodiesterase
VTGFLVEETSMSLAALPTADQTPRPHHPVLNLAHRGASCSSPENTLAAVHLAADSGADIVEIDVRLSRDGVPMVVHDETLERTTDARHVFPRRAPWRVGDLDHHELRCLDAGSWFSPAFAGEPLATLDEVLDAASGRALGLLVELKSPRRRADTLTEVAAVVRRQRARSDDLRLAVQSFDHTAMRELKSSVPSVPVGVLGAPSIRELAALSEWADQVNPQHLCVSADYVEAVHLHGMRCHVWTVNRRVAMRRAVKLGVDGIITNRPRVLRDVLDRHSSLI